MTAGHPAGSKDLRIPSRPSVGRHGQMFLDVMEKIFWMSWKFVLDVMDFFGGRHGKRF